MKIECHCGALIHDHTDGMAHKAHLLPDQALLPLLEQIDDLIENHSRSDRQREATCMKIRSLLTQSTRGVWQCNQCGRLYLNDQQQQLVVYSPECDPPALTILAAE